MKLEDIQKSFLKGLQPGEKLTLNLTKFSHFNAYKNSYTGNLVKTLEKIFPVFYKLIGHELFNKYAIKFIHSHPSKDCDLNLYGDMFPSYLNSILNFENHPYLGDVIRLELIYHNTLLKTNEYNLDINKLIQQGNLEEFLFTINSSFNIISSKFPLDKIWIYNMEDNDYPLNISIDNYNFIIYKINSKVFILSLDDQEISFINQIMNEKNIESILNENDSFLSIFQKFLQNGIINNYRKLL